MINKMNFTMAAQNKMDEAFKKGNDSISIINSLHAELNVPYKADDIITTSTKLKELIGFDKGDKSIELQKKAFQDKFCEKGLEISSSDMNNKLVPWLTGLQNPQTAKRDESHDFMLKLCGVFDMNIQETEEFIAKAFFRRAFYKNVHDVAIYYCIYNRVECKEWDNVCVLSKRELSECKVSKDEKNILYTSYLYEQLDNVTNIQELKDFIHQHADGLTAGYTMSIARQELERLLKLSTDIVAKIINDNEFENYDSLSANQFKKTNNSDVIVSSMYNPYVLMNFPSKASINKIRSGKGSYDSIRKAITLLHFFVFISNEKNQALLPEDRFKKYNFEADLLMTKCGFPKLWIVNPYEKLFMYCVHHNDPLEVFRAFVSDMYRVNDGMEILKNKKSVFNTNIKAVIDIIYGFDTNKIQK